MILGGHRPLLLTGGIVVLTTGLLAAFWGYPGAAIGAMLSFLTVAFRYDNKAGLYSPLALLFVISFMILALLLVMLTFVLPQWSRS